MSSLGVAFTSGILGLCVTALVALLSGLGLQTGVLNQLHQATEAPAQ